MKYQALCNGILRELWLDERTNHGRRGLTASELAVKLSKTTTSINHGLKELLAADPPLIQENGHRRSEIPHKENQVKNNPQAGRTGQSYLLQSMVVATSECTGYLIHRVLQSNGLTKEELVSHFLRQKFPSDKVEFSEEYVRLRLEKAATRYLKEAPSPYFDQTNVFVANETAQFEADYLAFLARRLDPEA